MNKHRLLSVIFIILVLSVSTMLVGAGDRALNINSGTNNAVFFISGEPTLVINGFDLSPLGLTLPARIDKLSIVVDNPVPGTLVDAVIYQDSNGGSPVDATLVAQRQVDITQAGLFTVTFDPPVNITAPVVWAGFYLPVNFRFQADQSGSSVLTYWGWTPGARFDLNSLASAQVFGPANGSSPVNFNMQGIARITAEISGSNGTPIATNPAVLTPLPNGTLAVTQIVSSTIPDMSVLKKYPPACDTLLWDTADHAITLRSAFNLHCAALFPGYGGANPVGYERRQLLYEVYFYNERGQTQNELPFPVTHCIEVNPADVNTAVVGVAYGAPREWKILPSVRFNNLVCAEVQKAGSIAYFVPTFVVVPTATATPTS